MVHGSFLRPAWCHEATRIPAERSDDLLGQAYFDCYFVRFPEWYFRLAMGVPATLWAEASPGRHLRLSPEIEGRLERFQRLLESYGWGMAVMTPDPERVLVHHFLLQAVDRAGAGLEQLRLGDVYGALVRWQRAAEFIAAIEQEVSAFRLRLLVDSDSYIDCASPESWPPHLES